MAHTLSSWPKFFKKVNGVGNKDGGILEIKRDFSKRQDNQIYEPWLDTN